MLDLFVFPSSTNVTCRVEHRTVGSNIPNRFYPSTCTVEHRQVTQTYPVNCIHQWRMSRESTEKSLKRTQSIVSSFFFFFEKILYPFFFFFLFFTLYYPFGEIWAALPGYTWTFGPPYPGNATAAARAALPSPTSACWVFSCFCNAPNSDNGQQDLFNVRS